MQRSSKPSSVHLLGNILSYRAFPEDTGHRYAIVECLTAPGAGAPPNRHAEDEIFIVLEGQVAFDIEGTSRVAGPGETVVIPNRALHSFVNIGEEVARMLLIHLPGAAHVAFYFGAGEPLAEGASTFPEMSPPDVQRLVAIGAEAGLEIVAPA